MSGTTRLMLIASLLSSRERVCPTRELTCKPAPACQAGLSGSTRCSPALARAPDLRPLRGGLGTAHYGTGLHDDAKSLVYGVSSGECLRHLWPTSNERRALQAPRVLAPDPPPP